MIWIEEELSEEITKLSEGDYIIFNEKPQIIKKMSGIYESIPHKLSNKVWEVKATKYPNMVVDLVHSDDILIRQSINLSELKGEINNVGKNYSDLMKQSTSLDTIVQDVLNEKFLEMDSMEDSAYLEQE